MTSNTRDKGINQKMNDLSYKVFLNFNNSSESDFVLQIAIIHQNKENIFNIKQNGDLFLVHSADHELEIYFDSKADIIFDKDFIKIFSEYHHVHYENHKINNTIRLLFKNYLANNHRGFQEFINSKDKVNLFFTIDTNGDFHQLKNLYFEINEDKPFHIIYKEGFYYNNNDLANQYSSLRIKDFSLCFNYLKLNHEIKIPNYQYIKFIIKMIDNILKLNNYTFRN